MSIILDLLLTGVACSGFRAFHIIGLDGTMSSSFHTFGELRAINEMKGYIDKTKKVSNLYKELKIFFFLLKTLNPLNEAVAWCFSLYLYLNTGLDV